MDKDLALALYTESAAKGFAKAEYELARHYGGLAGTKVDLEQGFVYLQKAAEHGHVPAQVDLGFLYFTGNNKARRITPSRSAGSGRHPMAVRSARSACWATSTRADWAA